MMKTSHPNDSRFDRLAQKVTEMVVRPWFFAAVALSILAWVPTVWLWETGPTDLLVDALTNPLSLVLLVLLQNAQSRQEHALDRRLDTLERALATWLQCTAEDDRDPPQKEALLRVASELKSDARERSREASAGENDV